MIEQITDLDGITNGRNRALSDTNESLLYSVENLAIRTIRKVAFPELDMLRSLLSGEEEEPAIVKVLQLRKPEIKKCEITKITVLKKPKDEVATKSNETGNCKTTSIKEEESLPDFKLMEFARLICNPSSQVLENNLVDQKASDVINLRKVKFA